MMKNKVWLLLKTYIWNDFGFNRAKFSGDKREKNRSVLYAVGVLFLGLLFLLLSFFYNFMIAFALKETSQTEVLLALMMAVSSLCVLFTTIYKASSVLYGIKDKDLLFSLPIPLRSIVASRILMLYLMNMTFVLIVMVPAAIAYAVVTGVSLLFWVSFIVVLPFLPLIPIIISSVLGAAITWISSRFRRANMIALVLVMGLLVLYFAVIMNVSASAGSEDYAANLAALGTMLSAQVASIYPPAMWYVQGVAMGRIEFLLLFLAVSAACFLLFCLVFSKSYQKICSAVNARQHNKVFRFGRQQRRSVMSALYLKERNYYFSSFSYIVNTSIGLVLLVVASIALLFVNKDQLSEILEIPMITEILFKALPYFSAMFIAMSCTSCVSISLEGKSLWIAQSLPLKAEEFFRAKILFNLSLTCPAAVVAATLQSIAVQAEFFDGIMLFIVPLSFAVLSAVFGLWVNLKMPVMQWKDETVVIKRSASATIGMLGAMFFSILAGAFAVIAPIPGRQTSSIVIVVVVLVLSALLYMQIKKTAEKKLMELIC